MKTTKTLQEDEYIETPRLDCIVTKIDTILEARMKEFIRARRIRRFTFNR